MRGYRPPISCDIPKELRSVIEFCWKGNPALRPNMAAVVRMLREVRDSDICGYADADMEVPEGCSCTVQ
jgi:hypothetical protein